MFLFFVPLLLIGCTVSQKIVYMTDDLPAPANVTPIPAVVEVRILEDNRAGSPENAILFSSPRQVKLDGKQTCINSEKHYKKEPVVSQISNILVDHFNQVRLFDMATSEQNQLTNYYLSGTLNSFYAEQKFSTGAAIGASFGLVGALATSGIKTPGKIVIDISDLKLYRNDGTLVKDFGNFYKEFVDEFKADAHCWCAFWNANEKLKEFNTQLVEKIRSDMANVSLK